MFKRLRLVGELMAFALSATSWGLTFYGQQIAGHDVNWKWIAAVAGIVFVVLIYLHIFGLNSDIRTIKNARPVLAIVFKRREPMWDEAQRWYRVGIHNENTFVAARQVQVKLQHIRPKPHWQNIDVTPCGLGRMNAEPDKRASEEITINPDDTLFFDVLASASDDPLVCFLWTVVFSGQRIVLREDVHYELLITVSHGAGRSEQTFDLIQPKGRDIEFAPSGDQIRIGQVV